jgi:hypothetical protein
MRTGRQVELAQRRDGYIEKGERGTVIEIEGRSLPPSLSHPIPIQHPSQEGGGGRLCDENGIFEEGWS